MTYTGAKRHTRNMWFAFTCAFLPGIAFFSALHNFLGTGSKFLQHRSPNLSKRAEHVSIQTLSKERQVNSETWNLDFQV